MTGGAAVSAGGVGFLGLQSDAVFSQIGDWLEAHAELLWWFTGGSVLLSVITLVAIPVIVVRLPASYFVAGGRRHLYRQHIGGVILKNVAGVLLVLAGIAMLVLPGQGLLSMLVGLILIDFPGKRRLEQWLIRRRSISRPANWIRRRYDRPPFRQPKSAQQSAP